MKDPTTVFVNTVGSWPNVTGRNITVAGDGTGTEWIKEFVDTLWGSIQHLMNAASLTPDGVTEANGASQIFTSMQRSFGHPGELVPWHGQADPATLGLRLLKLDGSVLTRASYPELDTAVYVGDANNADGGILGYWRADNPDGSSRNVAGAYLKLPDLQGLFLRGTDPSATRDPDGATRVMPDQQYDAFETHGHELQSLSNSWYAVPASFTVTGSAAFSATASAGADRLQAPDSLSSILGGNPDDDETRARNSQVTWCVRY